MGIIHIYIFRYLRWIYICACVYAGVFACNNVEETSNAIEDEEFRVVDEEEAFAAGV